MKTPEEFHRELKKIWGENLKSTILYGSKVWADAADRYAENNLLVVAGDLGLPALKAANPVVKKWVKDGNPCPLFFTPQRIVQAEDVFPVEFLDIHHHHRVIEGENPFNNLNVSTTHLRHQLEHELRGKLILLRNKYLETDGNPKKIQALLAVSMSTLTILFKGVLRLVEKEVPSRPAQVWETLNKHIQMDPEAYRIIYRIRECNKEALKHNPEDLMDRVLKSVEAVIDFVDQYK